MKDNRKKIFKTTLKLSLDPNNQYVLFDYVEFQKNLIDANFSKVIKNVDIPTLEVKEGGITLSIQAAFAGVSDVTTTAVGEITSLKVEPYLGSDQPQPLIIKFAITENTIDLKTLSQLNPNIFSYDDGRKICSLIKNINLSEIKISENLYWNKNMFIIMDDGEKFCGRNKKITVDIDEYMGLFQFLYRDIPKKYPEILNLNVDFGNNLGTDGGGIVAEFPYFFKIRNCNAYGNINKDYGAGIVGGVGGDFEVINCNFYGNINCFLGSGIVGSFTAWWVEECIIKNCSYKGKIENFGCGGIIGGYSAIEGGNLYIINCKSECNIVELSFSGGIVGAFSGINGFSLIYNCNSDNSIMGDITSGRILSAFTGSYIDPENEEYLQYGELTKIYLINCSELSKIVGLFSDKDKIHILSQYKNKTKYLCNFSYNFEEETIIDGNIIRSIRFEKVNNANYYIIKRYYNFKAGCYNEYKLSGCEDLIIDTDYNLSANKVIYTVEAYDCNKNKLSEQEFIY